MRVIISSDWHLDDDPRHEYRWDIFRTVRSYLRSPDVVGHINCGDLGHKKDRHNGIMVNRMTREVCETRDVAREYSPSKQLHFLAGNHDYSDPNNPFFGYLDKIEGVEFHNTLKLCEFPYSRGVRKFLFVPHHMSWANTNTFRDGPEVREADIVFAHRTFEGAVASSGTEMDGYRRPETITKGTPFPPIISGDIHVPQELGRVTYVGSPHPVAFGDHFEPRLLSLDLETLELTTIPMRGLQRLSLDFGPADDGTIVQLTQGVRIEAGDHVKVRYNAPRTELGRWSEVQQDLKDLVETQLSATLFDLSYVCTDDDVPTADLPIGSQDREASIEEIFEVFCDTFGVPNEYRIPGRELIRDA